MLNGLDLFSGIGGLTLALEPWVKPVAYCENDRYAQSVLLSRMFTGALPHAAIWDDIRTLRADHISTPEIGIDIIYGGFPCQDISVAGHGVGLEGKRSGLYWELHRLVGSLRPSFVFLENVPAIRTRGLRDVVRSLTEFGYDCRWDIISAKEVGAAFYGDRWFLLAAANGKALRIEQRGGRREAWESQTFNSSARDTRLTSWTPERGFESRIFGTGNGVPFAVDRDRALGNAVVPAQAREAFKRLCGLK